MVSNLTRGHCRMQRSALTSYPRASAGRPSCPQPLEYAMPSSPVVTLTQTGINHNPFNQRRRPPGGVAPGGAGKGSSPDTMPTAKQWWRRAAAAVKDHRSLCLTRMAGRGGICNADMEMSIIRATSHDETCLDYKHARRVFALARASPSSLQPLMWSLARRATRTRSWPVALKSLLLAHGLLLLPSSSPLGRLPFDLSDFRSHRSRHSRGFSTFVRAYFAYLDQRSLFLTHRRRGRLLEDDDDKHAIVVSSPIDELDGDGDDQVSTVVELQKLLSLLMQIRPYGDGMDVGLILEAMDCAMIEIFDVYSGICNGIANFLVAYMGGRRADSSAIVTKGNAEETRRRGMTGIKVLRKAVEQSEQLSSYFDLCRRLGVLNAAELPPVERVPEEDIRDLEKLVMGRIDAKPAPALTAGVEGEQVPVDHHHHNHNKQLAVVVTDNWVVFEDEVAAAAKSRPGNPFLSIEDVLLFPGPQPQSTCASLVQQHSMVPFRFSGNLIDL